MRKQGLKVLALTLVTLLFVLTLGYGTVYATTAIAVQRISGKTPITVTSTAITVTAGLDFPNDGRVFLMITNPSGATANITVTTPYEYEGFTVQDLTFTVAAGATKFAGPLSPVLFNDSSGNANVQADLNGVTVAALRMGN